MSSPIRDEIFDLLKNDMMFYRAEMFARIITSSIEKRIDEKIQYIDDLINNETRLTIQGCQRLKGKKDAFEEMKDMLSK